MSKVALLVAAIRARFAQPVPPPLDHALVFNEFGEALRHLLVQRQDAVRPDG
jgi:hypothetical protein